VCPACAAAVLLVMGGLAGRMTHGDPELAAAADVILADAMGTLAAALDVAVPQEPGE
jgi:hypothetical protein